MKKIIVLTAISVLFLFPQVAHASSAVLAPSADVYIYNLAPTFNSGKAINMIAVNNPSVNAVADILLKFPLNQIPANANITRATLQLYLVSGSGGSPARITARPAIGVWDEGVNWNDRPDKAKVNGVTTEVNLESGLKIWDVTDIVREWKDGTRENDGLILSTVGVLFSDESFNRIFRTREGANSDEHPKLIVEYTVPSSIPQLELKPNAGKIVIDQDVLIRNGGQEVSDATASGNSNSSTVPTQASQQTAADEDNSPASKSAEEGMTSQNNVSRSENEQTLIKGNAFYSSKTTGIMLILLGCVFAGLAFVIYVFFLKKRKAKNEK